MNTHVDKAAANKSQLEAGAGATREIGVEPTFQLVDNRPEAVTQRKLQEIANNSPQTKQLAQLQAVSDNYSPRDQQPIQKKGNNTGLPDGLKSGIENLSGYSMDDVKVHRNSDQPAQLNAHAYAQGTDIHLGPGQEKHLPHEAWHVVQQKQGRVKPTLQMKGRVDINDDLGLEKEADVMGAKAIQMKGPSNEKMDLGIRSNVVQKTVWKKEGGHWYDVIDRLNDHDGKPQPHFGEEGQYYDDVIDKLYDNQDYEENWMPVRTRNQRKDEETKRNKPKHFKDVLGGPNNTKGGIRVFIASVFITGEILDEEVNEEQDQHQSDANKKYTGMTGVKASVQTGHKYNAPKPGKPLVKAMSKRSKELPVMVFTAHGNLHWFFEDEPGNEAAGMFKVAKWVREFEVQLKHEIHAIVLDSCHSAEELEEIPTGVAAEKNWSPARLLSIAIPGVRVVGFQGNVETDGMIVTKMRDRPGGAIRKQTFRENAVVFVNGEAVEGENQEGLLVDGNTNSDKEHYQTVLGEGAGKAYKTNPFHG